MADAPSLAGINVNAYRVFHLLDALSEYLMEVPIENGMVRVADVDRAEALAAVALDIAKLIVADLETLPAGMVMHAPA